MEYDVPRQLDVPDRLGIPFFTTVQFAILIGGCLLTYLLWKVAPEGARPWLIYVPLAALLLPRPLPPHGYTLARIVAAKAGRLLRRPRRTVWKPE